MAFLKVRNVKGKEDTIINTDLICRIAKSKNGYTVFFSSGNTGAAYYEYDEENAKRIFDAIGVYLKKILEERTDEENPLSTTQLINILNDE